MYRFKTEKEEKSKCRAKDKKKKCKAEKEEQRKCRAEWKNRESLEQKVKSIEKD